MPMVINNKTYSYIALRLTLLCIVLISGCISTPNTNSVSITNDIHFNLTSPPPALILTTESHLLEITHAEKTHRLITQIEYKPNEIVMAAISAEGIPLFDFVWRKDLPTKINQYVPLPNININNIIADIQLCHWPIERVTSSIKGNNAHIKQIETKNNAAIWQRIIYQDNKPVINVDKTTNGFTLKNILRNYHITLTHLNQEGSL